MPYPEQLLAYDLTIADLIDALEKNNNNVGAGYIEKYGEQYLIRVLLPLPLPPPPLLPALLVLPHPYSGTLTPKALPPQRVLAYTR